MGEGKKDASQLREVHHLLTQQKSDEAQALLDQVTDKTPAVLGELTYLQAWQTALLEQWEIVAQQVRGMPVLRDTEERESLLTSGSARRRRPICLLMLSEMARELGYPEEAVEHTQYALTLLNERRMNIPEVRLLAHVSLGRLALEMNQTAQALLQYKTARLLYQGKESTSPLYTTILVGLCEAQARQELFEQALATGKQALTLLRHSSEAGQRENLLILLSRVSFALEDCTSALAYAREAEDAASQSNDPTRRAHTLLVLAEIQQKGCQSQEARTHCEQALALLETTSSSLLKGNSLFLLGKIAEDEWHRHPTQEKYANQAQAHYEQAQALFEELHDMAALARVSTRLAQLLEARGEPALALTHWKQAFILAEQHG